MPHMCLNCQAVRLVRTAKDILVPLGVSPEVVPAVQGWHCPDCGAVMFFDGDGSSWKVDMPGHLPAQALVKQAEFIRDVRIRLNLTLQEAEEIFGGKEGSFDKYEYMEAIPPKALILLLKILEKRPYLLDEVRS